MLKNDLFLLRQWTLAHAHFHLWPSLSEYRTLRDSYNANPSDVKTTSNTNPESKAEPKAEPKANIRIKGPRPTKRYYHTWHHIYATIHFVQTHFGFHPHVIFALFYHDVIYDTSRKDNEKASADVWIEYARRRGLDESYSESVMLIKDLILMTETHKVPEPTTLTEKKLSEDVLSAHKITCDADMSIFTFSQDEYLRYARDIWREYHGVGKDAFVKGRLQFLKTVKPEEMYYTDPAREFVEQARTNIEFERRVLEIEPQRILVEVSPP